MLLFPVITYEYAKRRPLVLQLIVPLLLTPVRAYMNTP